MSGMMSRGGPMSGMMGHSHDVQSQSKSNGRATLVYSIPSVHCGHCKSTIERKGGELSGVASVSVDVDTKQAVIEFDLPATKTEIEAPSVKLARELSVVKPIQAAQKEEPKPPQPTEHKGYIL